MQTITIGLTKAVFVVKINFLAPGLQFQGKADKASLKKLAHKRANCDKKKPEYELDPIQLNWLQECSSNQSKEF